MKESREVLKARILDGAAALFKEKGIEKVTTRELTERLLISRSHIYYYFSDWQTLCIEALRRFMQQDLDQFIADTDNLPPAKKLSVLIENYLPGTPGTPDAVWQLYGSLWQLAGQEAIYAELVDTFIQKWGDFNAAVINEGIAEGAFRQVNTVRVVRQLSAMLNGYADHLIIYPSEEKYREAVDDVQAFIDFTLNV